MPPSTTRCDPGCWCDGYNGSQALDEVWSLSLSGSPAWSLLQTTGSSPGPRYLQTAVYDPVRDRIIVFGGLDANNSYTGGVWPLSLSGVPTWPQLAPTGPPPASRIFHTAIYDPVRDRMLVFGGYTGSAQNDVWSLSLAGATAWSQLATT